MVVNKSVMLKRRSCNDPAYILPANKWAVRKSDANPGSGKGGSMIVEQRQWTDTTGWRVTRTTDAAMTPQLVLFFGAREALSDPAIIAGIRSAYPDASLLGCSTAGEI